MHVRKMAGVLLIASTTVLHAHHAFGQALSARGSVGGTEVVQIQSDLQLLQTMVASVVAEIAALKTKLDQVIICHARSKFYAPSTAGSDADGCVGENDPKVGSMEAGQVCTSDGAQITCTSAGTNQLTNLARPRVGRLFGGGGGTDSFSCEAGFQLACFHMNVRSSNNAFFCQCYAN